MSAVTPDRVLAVWCPDWPVVAVGADPDTVAAVVVKNVIFACSFAARAEGVRRGQRTRDAQRLAPGLVLRARDEAAEARAFEPLLGVLAEYTPRFEVVRPGLAALPVAGPARYFGGEDLVVRGIRDRVGELGVGSGVGVAEGVFAAALAARSDTRVVPGRTAEFLAPFPTSVLELPELVEPLARLGVSTLGRLAELPADAVAGRFGAAGVAAHRLARGLDARPPAPLRQGPDLAVSAVFDPPADASERIVFAAKSLADELHTVLAQAGVTCVRVAVEIHGVGGAGGGAGASTGAGGGADAIAEAGGGAGAGAGGGADAGAEASGGAGAGVGGGAGAGAGVEPEVSYRLWRHEGLLSSTAVAERVRWQLSGWQAQRAVQAQQALQAQQAAQAQHTVQDQHTVQHQLAGEAQHGAQDQLAAQTRHAAQDRHTAQDQHAAQLAVQVQLTAQDQHSVQAQLPAVQAQLAAQDQLALQAQQRLAQDRHQDQDQLAVQNRRAVQDRRAAQDQHAVEAQLAAQAQYAVPVLPDDSFLELRRGVGVLFPGVTRMAQGAAEVRDVGVEVGVETDGDHGITLLRLIPDQLTPALGVQPGLWGADEAPDRIARAAERLQAMYGPGAVVLAADGGGRSPLDQGVRTFYGDLPAGRVEAAPWPGGLPAPAPADVPRRPRPAEVTDRDGAPVAVSGRLRLSAPPAVLTVPRTGTGTGTHTGIGAGERLRIVAWAGPWPLAERWWEPGAAVRRARFQAVTDDGRAWLLAVQDGAWLIEAVYD